LLPVPGLNTGCLYAQARDAKINVWTLTAFDAIPWMNRDGPPGSDSLFALIWSVTGESPVPKRSAWRRPDANASSGPVDLVPCISENRERTSPPVQASGPSTPTPSNSKAREETYWQREYDGHVTKLAVPYVQEFRTQSMPDAVRYGLAVLLAIGVLVAVHFLTSRAARKLFGLNHAFQYGNLIPKVPLWTGDPKGKDASFYARWRKLDQEDRLLLHQLSKRQLVNPANTRSIKKLAHERLIKFDPWPKIADDSFKEFVETAEDQADFATWQSEASKSVWNNIRTPLLILLLVVIGVLLWVSSTSMQIVMTVLAGVATLLGYLGQAQSFIRGSGGAKGS